MFRQLGQSPPESEMKAMIDAVDADSSGTVDFEEFCLLMLRMKRAAITPSWLLRLFVAGSDTDDDDAESAGDAVRPLLLRRRSRCQARLHVADPPLAVMAPTLPLQTCAETRPRPSPQALVPSRCALRRPPPMPLHAPPHAPPPTHAC